MSSNPWNPPRGRGSGRDQASDQSSNRGNGRGYSQTSGQSSGRARGYSQAGGRGYSQGGNDRGYSQGSDRSYYQGNGRGYSQGNDRGYSQAGTQGYNQGSGQNRGQAGGGQGYSRASSQGFVPRGGQGRGRGGNAGGGEEEGRQRSYNQHSRGRRGGSGGGGEGQRGWQQEETYQQGGRGQRGQSRGGGGRQYSDQGNRGSRGGERGGGRGRGNGKGDNKGDDKGDSKGVSIEALCNQFMGLDIEDRKNPFQFKHSDSPINEILSADNVPALPRWKREPCKGGREVELETNYFRINKFKSNVAEYYEVTIKLKPPPKEAAKGDEQQEEQEQPQEQGQLEEECSGGRSNVEVVTRSRDRNLDRMNKEEKRALINQFINILSVHVHSNIHKFAYDGAKSLYALGRISDYLDGKTSYSSDIEYKSEKYEVSINLVERVPLGFIDSYLTKDCQSKRDSIMCVKKIAEGSRNDVEMNKIVSEETDKLQKCFQVLDIALRHSLTETFLCYGRSYFNSGDQGTALKRTKFLYQGFYANFRFCFGRLAINVDAANGVFLKERPLREHLQMEGIDIRACLTNAYDRKRASDLVDGLRIKLGHFDHPRYTKATGITDFTPATYTFKLDRNDDTEISVQQYYLDRYHIEVDPNLPMVSVTKSGTFYPLDVCIVPFTRISGTEDGLAQQMIKITAKPAGERKQLITTKLNGMRASIPDQFLNEWGIKFNHVMEKINGRILEFPLLQYNKRDINGKIESGLVRVAASTGARPMQRFLYPARFDNSITWACLNTCFNVSSDTVTKFVKVVAEKANRYGVNLAGTGPCYDTTPENAISKLYQNKLHDFNLLFVINDGIPDIYGSIKSIAELQFGLITQFLQPKTLTNTKQSDQIAYNICHKLNPKLGGVNASLCKGHPWPETFDISAGDLPDTMFVGIDVTHNVFKDTDKSSRVSIAAVVASMDHHPSHYEVSLCCQKNPSENRQSMEIVADMRRIMLELLEKYKKRNEQYPKRIFVYRDGVSEGQFKTVLNYEFAAIDGAVRSVMPNKTECLAKNEPCGFITYCVVQKRHHTRFFPTIKLQNGTTPNIEPGTLVDSAICMNTEFDFFLCSHRAVQGTAKPTYYRVLADENQLSRQAMAQLTFHLCCMYSRCAQPVSNPAPCYYAHHAAFRARHYVDFYSKSDPKLKAFVYEDDKKRKDDSQKPSDSSDTSDRPESESAGERKKKTSVTPSFVNIASIHVTPEMSRYLFFV